MKVDKSASFRAPRIWEVEAEGRLPASPSLAARSTNLMECTVGVRTPLDGDLEKDAMYTAAVVASWKQRAMRTERDDLDEGDDVDEEFENDDRFRDGGDHEQEHDDSDDHASWLQEDDGDYGDESGDADGEAQEEDPDAVIPWLADDECAQEDCVQSRKSRAESDEKREQGDRRERTDERDGGGDEEDEPAEDFSGDWADEYLSMDANASSAQAAVAATIPTASSTVTATSGVWKQSDNAQMEQQGLSKPFSGYEGHRNSLRNEIDLVGQATDKAAAAAMGAGKEQEPIVRSVASVSAASPLPRHQSEESFDEVLVHPIPTILDKSEPQRPPLSPNTLKRAKSAHPIPTILDKSERQRPPLSPNTLKRANSVYLTPTSTSKVLMKRQDPMTINVSRSQMIWNAEASRRSSRLLDEWKRKEIWHDFKRAEENVSWPHAKPVVVAEQQETVLPEVRLENLLQNLRAELTSSRTIEKPDQATRFVQRNGVAEEQHSPFAPAFDYPNNPERRQTMGAATSSASSIAPRSSAPGCSRSEYEQVLEEKRLLKRELESSARSATTDKEAIKNLSERIHQLENSERENKFLKDEIQKHLMQKLSSKELVKTLSDQLVLTSKSEEQLKLQTQQLFQQNQSLQSDLLEKIATEASKIQKMAHLSAEKENLMQELERANSVSSKKELEEKQHLQEQAVRRLLRMKWINHLRSAMATWKMAARNVTHARCRAFDTLCSIHRQIAVKGMAKAFNRLKIYNMEVKQQAAVSDLQRVVDETNRHGKVLAIRNGALIMKQVMDRWQNRQLRDGFSAFQLHRQQQLKWRVSLEHACTKLHLLNLGKTRSDKQNAFSKWKTRVQTDGVRISNERARESEKDLIEAKDCVFSLSREKTKLEEKLQNSRDDSKRLIDQLAENKAELQVVKHGYVATVIRGTERAWLRMLFTEWRLQSNISTTTKDLRLQAEMAELKAAERDKHAKSVDDYNRVLRNDLERFQFFSQDKRIAVDVLTKKLLREEEKFKQMEEHQVLLEERAHSLRSQLSALSEWDGLELPLSMLSLSKDIAISNLRELFLLHATVNGDPNNGSTTGMAFPSLTDNGGVDSVAPRLSMESLLRMIGYSTLLEENRIKRDEVAEKFTRHFPDYAVKRGLLFPDFLAGLNNVLQDVFHASSDKSEQMKSFWASLLALVDPSRCGTTTGGSGSGREHMVSGQSPWAGRLSDDILQNQEKLLAVLEHETAVVERAVMEKSSLKHTYPASDHASVASTFYEYQCDPMLPPEPGTTHLSPVSSSEGFPTGNHSPAQPPAGSPVAPLPEMYSNWYQTAQIRDLFLAFHQPLLKVLVKYSNEKRIPSHGNQFCLQLSGILKMLEDMKLYPTYLSKEMVHHVFGSLCDRDGLLTPQAFTLFLGSCALELYAKSLAGSQKPSAFPLSAREILVSFFCDLGFLAESEAPAPSRICFVGMEIENILWPLFEYYAATDENGARDEGERVSMTPATFAKFMAEIAGAGAGADDIFHRVMRESRRMVSGSSSGSQKPRKMYFDEFYAAISYIQEGRNKQITYPNPGEAVRQWMQQTQ